MLYALIFIQDTERLYLVDLRPLLPGHEQPPPLALPRDAVEDVHPLGDRLTGSLQCNADVNVLVMH